MANKRVHFILELRRNCWNVVKILTLTLSQNPNFNPDRNLQIFPLLEPDLPSSVVSAMEEL